MSVTLLIYRSSLGEVLCCVSHPTNERASAFSIASRQRGCVALVSDAVIRAGLRVGPPRAKGLGLALFQGGEVGPEIDVIGVSVNNEGRNGLHACRFSLCYSALCLAKMHDLDVILSRIELVGELALRLDTDGAAGMIEDCFLVMSFCSLLWRRCVRVCGASPHASTRPIARQSCGPARHDGASRAMRCRPTSFFVKFFQIASLSAAPMASCSPQSILSAWAPKGSST